MKKLLLLFVITVGLLLSAKAQQNSWGVRVGMNISSASDKVDEGPEPDYKNKVGFRIGVIGDLGLTEHFYIQPGLYFTTLGAKQEVLGKDATVNLNYLQLPVLFSYRFNVAENVKLHINAGPYIGYGIGGKIKYAGVKIDAFGDGEDEGGLKRFDAGLSFGAGISVKQIYFGLNYDLGLANIVDKDVSEGVKSRLRNFGITVGYNF